MAERDKELQLLEKRFAELADRAWQQNLFVFTGFLSLVEQEVLWRSAAKAGVHIELYGGMDGAERCMGRFGDPEEFGYEEPFPICAVKIEPLAEKFAENFSHRDFMGAILNLGIDRSTIGDICVEGKCAYVFCTSAMSVFLQETLEQVRHTKVRCVPVEKLEALPEKKLSYREELFDLRSKFGVNLQRPELASFLKDFTKRDMLRGNPGMVSKKFSEALEELKKSAVEYKKREKK